MIIYTLSSKVICVLIYHKSKTDRRTVCGKKLFDPSYYEQYSTAEKLAYYFEKGKTLSEATAQRNAQEKESEKPLVIKGKPTKEEKKERQKPPAPRLRQGKH